MLFQKPEEVYTTLVNSMTPIQWRFVPAIKKYIDEGDRGRLLARIVSVKLFFIINHE